MRRALLDWLRRRPSNRGGFPNGMLRARQSSADLSLAVRCGFISAAITRATSPTWGASKRALRRGRKPQKIRISNQQMFVRSVFIILFTIGISAGAYGQAAPKPTPPGSDQEQGPVTT